MNLTGYDAAHPPANPPTTDVVCLYGGGDTPHVWLQAEIAKQKARYRLPIFVRSNPFQASAIGDASLFMGWLRSVGCPKGSATVLDLETAVAPAYVYAFGSEMHANGYLVLPYGSSSTLFKNPKLDGYWVALPGANMIPSNCVGVQYGQGGSGAWDNDWFSTSIPLWDTQPPAPSPPKEKAVLIINDGTTQYLLFESGTKLAIPDGPDLTALSSEIPALGTALTPAFVATIHNA